MEFHDKLKPRSDWRMSLLAVAAGVALVALLAIGERCGCSPVAVPANGATETMISD